MLCSGVAVADVSVLNATLRIVAGSLDLSGDSLATWPDPTLD